MLALAVSARARTFGRWEMAEQRWSNRKEAAMSEEYFKLTTGELYYSGFGVGEMWEEIGQLQFNFLVRNGLLPSHRVLDIGCGSLRAGVHVIKYLDRGNYCGFERSAYLITAAREYEIPRYRLQEKDPQLHIRDDFHFSICGGMFDVLLAQSVFTHLAANSIQLCLRRASEVMHGGSRLFATFFENATDDHCAPCLPQREGGFTFLDRDPFHYSLPWFQMMAGHCGLNVTYLGDWNHPRNQKMLLFMKKASS